MCDPWAPKVGQYLDIPSTAPDGYSWRKATRLSEPKLQLAFRMLVNYNSLMTDCQCVLTVMDLADVLKLGFGIVTGGLTKQGHPIITFPDIKNTKSSQSTIDSSTYNSLIAYLASIPPPSEIETGFVIIIDRRNSSWNSLKTLLLQISENFPGDVREVLIMKPTTLMQRAFLEVGYRLLKDDLRVNVHFCEGDQDLRQRVGSANQLTSDLGGSLQFDNQVWIEHRLAVERFAGSTEAIISSIEELCTRLSQAEFPNNIESTKELIVNTKSSKEELSDELACCIRSGGVLLSLLKDVPPSDQGYDLEKALELKVDSIPPSRKVHIACAEKLISTLKDSEEGFQEFWVKHQNRLNQCLTLREFEHDFKNLQSLMEEHSSQLQEMTSYGDCAQSSQNYIDEMRTIQTSSEGDIAACQRLEHRGQQFIEADHYAVDCIRPKCLELLRVVHDYNEMTRLRNQMLTAVQTLHRHTDAANEWSKRGRDLLTSLQVDQCTNTRWAEQSIHSLDDFLASFPEDLAAINLDQDPLFQGLFERIGYELKTSLEQSISQTEEVRVLCEKRRENLERIIRRPVCSVQPVRDCRSSLPSPDVDYSKKNVSNSASASESIRNRTLLSHVVNELVDSEKNYVFELYSVLNGYESQFDNPAVNYSIPNNIRQKRSIIFGNLSQIYAFHKNYFLKDLETCRDNPSEVSKCFSKWKDEFMLYSRYCQNKPDSDNILKQSADGCQFFLDCQLRLGHKLPLASYLLKPVQRIMKYQLLIREMLKYTEDSNTISELKLAMQAMLRAIQYANDVMHEVAISGHKGDTAQYGELLMQGSFSVACDQPSKRSLPAAIALGAKRSRSRHIFLYERALLFCKRKEDVSLTSSSSSAASHAAPATPPPSGATGSNAANCSPSSTATSTTHHHHHNDHAVSSHSAPQQPVYVYKSKVEMSQIGLTENIKSDKRKFEVWLHGRSEVYTIQAPSLDVKKAWTLEIAKVLSRQFANIKNKNDGSPGSAIFPQKRVFPHSKSLPTTDSPSSLRKSSISDDGRSEGRCNWGITNIQNMSLNNEDEVFDSDEGCHSKNTDSNRLSIVTSSDEDKDSSTGYISSERSLDSSKLSVTLV